MPVKRNLGKGLGGFFFATFLTFAIFTFSLTQILEPSNITPVIKDLLQLGGQSIDNMFGDQAEQVRSTITTECANKDNLTLSMPMQAGLFNITIDCEEASSDPVNSIINGFVNEIYYKEYECEILECINNPETMLAIFSHKASESLIGVTYIMFILAALSAIFFALSCKGWGLMKGFGVLFISVGITYPMLLVVGVMLPSMITSIAGSQAMAALPVIKGMIDAIAFNFLPFLIIGVILVITAYIVPRLEKLRLKKTKK